MRTPTASLALSRRRAVGSLALLGAGLLALPALGCGLIAPPVEATRTSTLAHVAGSAVSVETANGSISVSTSASEKDVTVVAKLKARTQERLDATKVLAERKPDNSLAIYVKWPGDSRESNEGCSFEVRLPDVNGVTARSSNGSVVLSGTAGVADVKTSNGPVTITSHTGAVKVKTSNGSVVGSGLSGQVDISTSNGPVTLGLDAAAIGPVDIDTSNGSVTLTLNAAFAGELDVKTSNGAIALPEQGPTISSRTKDSATLRFGQGGAKSKVRTSNGPVTVSQTK